MTTVSVEEAGPRLAELMELAARGERVVITGAAEARVELRAEDGEPAIPRRPGRLEGVLVVGPEFFEPLPDAFVEGME